MCCHSNSKNTLFTSTEKGLDSSGHIHLWICKEIKIYFKNNILGSHSHRLGILTDMVAKSHKCVCI